MRIAILVPSHESVPMHFAYDLAQLYANTIAAFPPDSKAEIGLYAVTGTYIHRARQELLEQALDDSVDYVLWIDSDMRFPADALLWLLEHEEDVVGINYAQRAMPTDFVAIKRVPMERGEVGEKLITNDKSEGLEAVDAMGFGLCLMRAAPLRAKLPNPGRTPWFWYEQRWPGDHVGEDVWFYRLLREECGLTCYVDHDLSKVCGHIGSFTFSTTHAALERNG
jgi:hypothetical protein